MVGRPPPLPTQEGSKFLKTLNLKILVSANPFISIFFPIYFLDPRLPNKHTLGYLGHSLTSGEVSVTQGGKVSGIPNLQPPQHHSNPTQM